MIVIGLTGGIAAGKSTVARLLAERGAVVVDADKLGHRVYARGQPALDKVVAAFGGGVVGEDGEIDRKALGAKVFGDAVQMKKLTDIVWPAILELAQAELATARAGDAKVAVLEAAVLIEANWLGAVDEVWAVEIPPALAVARASARDGVDAASVQARIDAQLSNAERAAHAQVVIENAGSPETLRTQVDARWQRLQAAA